MGHRAGKCCPLFGGFLLVFFFSLFLSLSQRESVNLQLDDESRGWGEKAGCFLSFLTAEDNIDVEC